MRSSCLVLGVAGSMASNQSHHLELPPFSISGHSSGGSMASNHFAAFSGTVTGLGHLQAAPYGCAAQAAPRDRYHLPCTTAPDGLSVDALVAYAAAAHAAGKIDDPANWAARNVYLYAGGADSVVKADVVRKAAELYGRGGGTGTGKVALHVEPGAQHAFATDIAGYGNDCGVLASPYINYCGYDMAGAVLAAIYGAGNLAPRVDPVDSHVVAIDQGKYLAALGFKKAADASMAETAYVYVPTACKADPAACARIHVVYHGCQSYFGAVADAIYVHTGYNNWAEANDILLLYPQTVAKLPENAAGCWDWYGFLNGDFDTREGVQIAAVNAMVAGLRETVAGAPVQAQLAKYVFSRSLARPIVTYLPLLSYSRLTRSSTRCSIPLTTN